MIPIPPVFSARLRHLRARLAGRLDADLSGVRLAVVPRLPADGFAFGDLILVAEHVLRRDADALLRVVVHELVHVFQQRAGRVVPNARFAGLAFSDDTVLEAEARAAADLVAGGGRLALRAPCETVRGSPVLQPLISVQGHVRPQETDFSPAFVRVLGLVPQGPSWLRWALRVSSPTWLFDDEAGLLAAIQGGLYGTPVAVYQSAGLRLSPSALFDLSEPDFGNIAGGLEGGQLTPASLAALTHNGICTESDFARLDTVLGALGVSGDLAARPVSIAQQVLLLETLADNPAASGSAQAGAAAGFAAGVARTAPDFSAAFAFYLAVSAANGSVNPASDDAACRLWTQFAGLVFDYLKCPAIPADATDAVVLAELDAYLGRSAFVGFPSLGVAVSNCALNAGLPLSEAVANAAVADGIQAYMLRLKDVVQPRAASGDAPASPRVRRLQDGVTRWYDFANAQGSARLQLDGQGLLTLLTFVPATTAT